MSLREDDSRYLLQAADRGDAQALDRLFDRARPRLRALLAMRAGPLVRRRVDLEDLVQEAYVEAFKQFDSYTWQGDDSFFRWLATVALNRVHNLRRMQCAERRDVRREERLVGAETRAAVGGVADLTDPEPGPRTRSVGSETQSRIEAALARLSATDREVIVLSRMEGRSLTEVAAQLGRTRNATALLLSRALRKLRDLLAEGDPA